MNILVLYIHYGSDNQMRKAIYDHLHVFDYLKDEYNITYYNLSEEINKIHFSQINSNIPKKLEKLKIDILVLHTTLLCYRWTDSFFYRFKESLEWIKNIDCLKIALPQDEYDHSDILDEWLFDWGIDIIFSCFHLENRDSIYRILKNKVTFIHCLTGYIDNKLLSENYLNRFPFLNRKKKVVYRASNLPYWFGSHGQIKTKIADISIPIFQKLSISEDISTRPQDTIFGPQWMDFLASGQCVLGCESGSSVIDYRGEIKTLIRGYLQQNPKYSFEEISSKMPTGWDDYMFFSISPRHFEAIITRTCQILVEGTYNNILQKNNHYIPIKKDLSNINELPEIMCDTNYLMETSESVYNDIGLNPNYSYSGFAKIIQKTIEKFV